MADIIPQPVAQQPQGTYQMPSQVAQDLQENAFQIVRVLTEHEDLLSVLKREMRGEQLYEDSEGNRNWVQVDKPMFVKLNINNKPLKVLNKKRGVEEFICNDEAIGFVINILKMHGLNPVAPLTNITEEEIRADLLEMECKIAMLLTINRKKWGLQKSEYPMTVANIKVLIKDARYRAKDGAVLRALRTMTTRMEQTQEVKREKQGGLLN